MIFNFTFFILYFSLGLLSAAFLLFSSTILRFPEKKYYAVLLITGISLIYNLTEILTYHFMAAGMIDASLIVDFVQQIIRLAYLIAIPFFIDSYIHISPKCKKINNKILEASILLAIMFFISALFLPEQYVNNFRLLDNQMGIYKGEQGALYMLSEGILLTLVIYIAILSIASQVINGNFNEMLPLFMGILIAISFFIAATVKSLYGSYPPPYNFGSYSRINMGLLIFTLTIVWSIFRTFLRSAREVKETQHQLIISEKRLYSMAYIDKSTGLPNRLAFFRDAEEIMKRKTNPDVCLLLMDLDHFRDINESYGSEEGDHILAELANRYIANLSRELNIYRFGGDEFAFFITGQGDEQKIIETAITIQKLTSVPIFREGNKYSLDCSMGIFCSKNQKSSVDTLLRNTSSALRHAKKKKMTIEIFNASLENESINRIKTVMALKDALLNHEFYLVYQPIVNVNGEIVSLEALIRWINPEGLSQAPSEFIPIAETAGMMPELGNRILEIFIKDHELIRSFLPDAILSLNISPAQLFAEGFVKHMKNMFSDFSSELHKIQLEVTETTFVSNYRRVSSTMEEFRAMGMKVALDDFGTGYSSLQHLQKLPVDVIKIDKSFLDEVPSNIQAISIVKSITELAEALDLKIIVEGVESPEQFEALKQLNCKNFQGFHFHRPMNLRDLKKMVEQ